jgi:hypothetical protein
LDPQFTGVCHLLIKINTENNHICIRGFDNDPALLFRRIKVTAHTKVFQVIEGRNIPDWKKFLSVKENKQTLINFFGDFIVKFNQSNPLVTSQDNQRLPGLKQLSQFPDFQMNRQCNTDFQGTLMGYFD